MGERKIKIFKSFEEQEKYFLDYFFNLSPSERLQALAKLQKINNPHQGRNPSKKITIRKHFVYGH